MHPTTQVPAPERRTRVRFRHWYLLGSLCCFALATAAPATQASDPQAKSLQELKAFFQQNCTRCQGLEGSARSVDGKKLGGLDFTQAAKDFRSLSGPASEREIRTMIRTIRKGILFGYTMPSWKAELSQEDATLMVREVMLKAEPGKVI